MKTSPLIQTKSNIVLKHERRRNMHAQAILRKTIIAIIQVTYCVVRILALHKTIREFHASIPQFYPPGGNYNRQLTKQKLLPEGKPHLNNYVLDQTIIEVRKQKYIKLH